MAKFYSDENFPYATVEVLRKLGHDVLTAFEAGQAERRIPDDQVLSYAIREERIVLTFNRKDFIKLHEKSSQHAGIVVCKVDIDFVGLAERIDKAIKDNAVMQGQLVRVTRRQFEHSAIKTQDVADSSSKKEAPDKTK